MLLSASGTCLAGNEAERRAANFPLKFFFGYVILSHGNKNKYRHINDTSNALHVNLITVIMFQGIRLV